MSPRSSARRFDVSDLPPRKSRIVGSFLEAWFADEEAGRVRELDEYISMFPGDASAVEEAWRLMNGDAVTSPVPSGMRVVMPDEGEVVGHYRLKREIGHGGQGSVYLADDLRVDRRAAVKVLAADGGPDSPGRVRFRREAEVAARLEHPGICPIWDMDLEGRVPWIAMPFLEGETLHARLGTCRTFDEPVPPPVPETLARLEQVARAVHAAHEMGVLHRDLKPSNIMIRAEGPPVVLDFGLATSLSSEAATLTSTGQVLGTLPYMSPEQLDGATLDRRCDVYALGVVLHESLTLRLPHRGVNFQQHYREVRHGTPPDPREHNPAVTRDLAVVVATALEKDVDRRYATAADLADELGRVLRDEPVLARPAGPVRQIKRFVRRRPAVAAFAFTGFLALVAGLVVTLVFLSRLDAEKKQTESSLDDVERLADARILDRLQLRSFELWPLDDRVVEPLREWIDRAEELLARLPRHERTLRELRAGALPWSDEDRRADHADVLARRHVLEDRRRTYLTEIDGREARGRRTDDLEDRVDDIDDELEQLAAREVVRRTWRFEREEDAWRHDLLHELVEALRTFGDGATSPLARMRGRFAFAESAERTTVSERAEAWRAATVRLATDTRFDGVDLTPKVGLVPLGRDPRSGLEEFCLQVSGEVPQRSPETGALAIGTSTGVVLVLLPGAKARIGAVRAAEVGEHAEPDAASDEQPVHTVELAPFLMAKYELTQHQFQRVMHTRPAANWKAGSEGLGRHPVENIDWHECAEVARRLGAELPTEVQWEYACRAGTTTPWWSGAKVGTLQDHANVGDEGARSGFAELWAYTPGLKDGWIATAPVGSKTPNGFGLHDMHGNVWEIVREAFGYYSSPARPGDGERVPTNPEERVARGGSFFHPAFASRASHREIVRPTVKVMHMGTRVSMPLW